MGVPGLGARTTPHDPVGDIADIAAGQLIESDMSCWLWLGDEAILRPSIIFGIGVATSVFGLTLLFYLIFYLRVLELVPSSEKSWPWPKPAPNWKRPSGGRIPRARPP
jgi:hypothetical protein